MAKKSIFVIVFLAWAKVLTACNGGTIDSSEPIPGLDLPIQVKEASLTVLDASIRNSMQTHYMMTYPKAGNVFYRLTVRTDNLSPDPDETLAWGVKNLQLLLGETIYAVAEAQRIIEQEHIEYKAAEKVSFLYVYFFEVPEDVQFSQFLLRLPDDQQIPVGQIVEIPVPVSKNEIDLYAVEAGGSQNSASAYHATVGGGQLNIASASHATVAGGRENSATYFYATIGGGYANTTTARDSVISGGSRNSVSAPYGTIGGGIQNNASAPNTTIAGGAYNSATDDFATIAGGTRNLASGFNSVIGGGAGNLSSADQSTISGGLGNQAVGAYASIGGGHENVVDGAYATIPGGFSNQANGNYSVAMGHQARVDENHAGTFLFSDSNNFTFASIAENEFAVRATGGIRLVTGIDENGQSTTGVLLPSGSGSWATLSNRDSKENITSIDPNKILIGVSELPITSWHYKGQDASVFHIGPMAQDFYKSFGFGEDEKHISTVDADGVALASIQALYQISKEQEAIIQFQYAQIEALENRVHSLENAHSINQLILLTPIILVISACVFVLRSRSSFSL